MGVPLLQSRWGLPSRNLPGGAVWPQSSWGLPSRNLLGRAVSCRNLVGACLAAIYQGVLLFCRNLVGGRLAAIYQEGAALPQSS